MTAVGDGRILERGYRRYTGRRESVGHAIRSTVAYTVRHVLGLRRPARYKILPVVIVLISFLPAAVFVGAGAFLPKEAIAFLPSYAQYYGYVSQVLILFAAVVIPDAICADRRSRSLSLYFASALTRMTYLASKAIAVIAVLCLSTLGPPLLMLIGFTLEGRGPDGPLGVAGTLGRIVACGLLLASAFAALGIGISMLTDRRAFATAGILFAIPMTGSLGALLITGFDAPGAFILTSFIRTQFETVRLIFGMSQLNEFGRFGLGENWWPVILAESIFLLVPAAFAVYKYQTGRVTR